MSDNGESEKSVEQIEQEEVRKTRRSPIGWFVGAVKKNLAKLSGGGQNLGVALIAILTLLGLGILLVVAVAGLLLAINAIAAGVLLLVVAVGGIIILLVATVFAMLIALIVGALSIPVIVVYFIAGALGYTLSIWVYLLVLVVWCAVVGPAASNRLHQLLEEIKNALEKGKEDFKS